MKNLKLLFFVFIIFICPNVFADTSYDMTSRITSPVNFSECGNGSYTGVELNGATNCWNTNTRYQGTLNRIYFNLPAPTGTVFESDSSYRLTLNMATQDWRNNFGSVVINPGSSYTNNFVDTFTFVSMKQVNITFTVPYTGSTTYQFLYVNLPAKNSSSLITGTSNWNLSNITLTKLTSGSGGGSTDPSGPSTTWDDTGIINSGKENTQDIINNNNNNTQDIINNNNENTQNIIENQQQLLGNCITNLMTGSDIISLDNLYSSGNNFQQITADTNTTLSLSLQAYNNGTYLYNLGDTQNITTTKTYSIRFTKTSDFNQVKFKINGSVRDTGLMINVSSLNDDYIYYISADFFRITQGDIRFNRLIIKENSSLGFAPWGETICLSKLDDVSNSINNSSDTIINNQNENTDKEIQSQKVCSLYDKSKIIGNGYINASGGIGSNSNFGYTDYIIIDKYSTIDLVKKSYDTDRFCFYNSSKSMISCLSNSSSSLGSITIPENAFYFRFSVNKTTNSPNFNICKSGNQAMSETLTDSNIDSGTGSDFFNGFSSQDFGLSQIITIPLNTIQSLTSKSCVPLQVPIPFTNSNVSLPCMTQIYETKFSSIYNLWKTVSFGIVAYLIAIDIFHIVKGFKDPESDKVEVLDL